MRILCMAFVPLAVSLRSTQARRTPRSALTRWTVDGWAPLEGLRELEGYHPTAYTICAVATKSAGASPSSR